MASIQEWNAEFGGKFEAFPEKPKGFSMDQDTAYPCRITAAKVVKSTRGDIQLEMSLDIQEDEGEDAKVLGKRREWLTLPKQESDRNLEKTAFEKITQRRYADMLRILSAAVPHDYALYATKEKKGDKNIFHDFDEKVMEDTDFSARTKVIQKNCYDFVDGLHERVGADVEELEQALLYFMLVSRKDKPQYPYKNFYANRPEKVKIHVSVSDSAPF